MSHKHKNTSPICRQFVPFHCTASPIIPDKTRHVEDSIVLSTITSIHVKAADETHEALDAARDEPES